MKKLLPRLRRAVSLDLSTIAILGGVALAASFAAAETLNLFALNSKNIPVYGSMPNMSRSLKPSAPAKPDRATLRKEAKKKRENLRLLRLMQRHSSSMRSSQSAVQTDYAITDLTVPAMVDDADGFAVSYTVL